jgi:hypothetical protein
VTSQDSFTGSTHVFKDIWAKLELTFTITKHPRIVGNWRKRFHHCTFSAKNKLLLELFVVLLNFKVKNVQQLLELMYHKVYGQR